MEATPASSNTSDIAGTDGKEGRVSDRKRFSVAGPRSASAGVHKETDAQEDWPSLATADPAFWLKGLD